MPRLQLIEVKAHIIISEQPRTRLGPWKVKLLLIGRLDLLLKLSQHVRVDFNALFTLLKFLQLNLLLD